MGAGQRGLSLSACGREGRGEVDLAIFEYAVGVRMMLVMWVTS